MANDTTRKTLANCKAADFLRQANKIRKSAKEYYDALNISGIRDRMAKKYAAQDENGKNATSHEYVSEILDAVLDANAEKTVEIIGMVAFLEPEQAQELEPAEMFDILLECLTSTRVMDFFIKMASLGGSDTANISQALISAKSLFSEMNTSGNTSPDASSDTNANASVGDMSGNA